ncbi:MAG: Flp pilus assembly protein CpaB [Chloroflexi bacterium]|nr:Flp pilus assembly protein CpaB [Chloroflexota bacterium]
MKRSNRLVLLIGIFLAVVAFAGVLILSGGGRSGSSGPPPPPTELPTVFATADIPLGTKIRADQVTVRNQPVTQRDVTAFSDTSLVIGKVVRENVVADAQLTALTLTGGSSGQILNLEVPAGQRAISIQVDQVTGVGTVIKNGDFVDLVVGLGAEAFPVITINPADDSVVPVVGLNGTSVKLLLQGMQVLGTLLPPPPPAADPNASAPPPGNQPTGLTPDQQQIVILSATAQQVEVIKFAELVAPGQGYSLVLRSPDDFVDEAGNKLPPEAIIPEVTTGIILKSLVDLYGVLPPELIETVIPGASPRP